ncbi:class I SAM-dependent methyltransferase [Dactylosporangium roseum]|uniref:Class I SAM-dependent methyltransferase n=1 Tax=Dactylosporangium roseum TaxID=47989 RepID=A0ABY5ZER3_9ACTN|nr:methyltransferase domain-containing protein [Dactylosporangium roseum]UWZ39252.1 class I SAM-dependent methyltransferase [Dactylosporangium roseum]
MASQLIDEYRRTSHEISQAIAPGWERRRAKFEAAVAPVREWMVRELAPRPGGTVLELAAGAGDTGFEAAEALGDDGRLISTDFSAAMLDVGRRRGAELGIRNAEFRVMDAEHLELDSGSVDGVLCRFGYMLMADPAAALAETRRVLRPGGRLALAVWDAPQRNPFFTAVVAALANGGFLPPPREDVPNPFSMANPAHTQTLLQAAGFGAVKVDQARVEFRFRDIDDYVSFMADTAGPLAVVLRKLSEQDRRTVAATLEDAFGTFATDGGYTVPGAALVAAAS